MSNKYRVEEKYYINQASYIELVSRMKHLISRDHNSDAFGQYRIDSLYFDDYINSCYHEKIDGVDKRSKYRIRCYDLHPETIHFEKKIRSGSFIRKEVITLDTETYHNILEGNFSSLGQLPLLTQFTLNNSINLLKPKLIVTYDREAFTLEDTTIRITFDKNLRVRMGEIDLFSNTSNEMLVFKDQRIILEIKYDQYLPSYIKNMLQIGRHERYSISKYALCFGLRKQIIL